MITTGLDPKIGPDLLLLSISAVVRERPKHRDRGTLERAAERRVVRSDHHD
jgi:hypothetical protein